MGDYLKKPKNYRRGRDLEFGGRDLEFERICREESATVVIAKPCERDFPCIIDIMVLAGLEQPCECCRPNVQTMRDLHGWERHPATHGTFYTSKHVTPAQQELIAHRIAQADIRNWTNDGSDTISPEHAPPDPHAIRTGGARYDPSPRVPAENPDQGGRVWADLDSGEE